MSKKLASLLCLALALGLAGTNPLSGAVLELRIATGSDDAEEHLVENPRMDLTSSDLEMPNEDWVATSPPSTDPQLVGMRWILPLGKDTVLKNVYIEFILSETKGNMHPVNLIIEGQLAPNPPTFTTAAKNISNRPRTKAQVKWTVPTGLAVGDKFQTPDLSPILNELLSQDGWASGNAIVIMIRDDPDNPSTGIRNAESFNTEGGAKAPLLHIEHFVGQATNPDPANGAPAVTMPLLTWTAGDDAVFHNVYVGTSPELTAANLVAPGQPVAMYYHAPGIEPGVTYYWRVDEVDAAGVVYTGDVWKFTAEPVTAWGPTPGDGAVEVVRGPSLSWMAAKGAVEHQVFLGTNRLDVILGAADADKGKTIETKFDTGLLALGTTYYWRVDGILPENKVVRGLVWSFTTAEALDLRIATGSDDAEEHLNAGMDINSTDLELVHEDPGTPATDEQVIGMRWLVPLAKDDVITKAHIEFQLKEIASTAVNTAPVNVIIEGQLDPDPPTFTTAAKNISSRTPTKAQVQWTIPTGMAVGDKFQTPDLSPIFAELIGQAGWAPGNAVVIMIRDDKSNPSTGIRCVFSYNGSAAAAPLLHVEVLNDPAMEPAAAPKATILWVSEAYDDTKDGARDDQAWIDFLTAQGYEVDYRMGTTFGNGFWRTLNDAKLEALNAADLVIVSRNMNSGEYIKGTATTQWNSVKTPLILMSPHVCRSSHWKWYNSTSIPDGGRLMQPVDAKHPAFVGVTVDEKGQVAAIADARRFQILGVKEVGNGTVIATDAANGNAWIALWEAGVEFYAGAGQFAGGPRVFFGAGTQEAAATATVPAIGRGELNLTDSGLAVFLNVIDMLLQ